MTLVVKFNILGSILLLAITVLVQAFTIPSHVQVCRRSDNSKYAKCLRDKIEQYRHLIYKDLPELNLPSFDPFRIPKMVVKQKRDSVDINLVVKDLVVTGFGDFQVEKLKVNLDDLTGEIEVRVPVCNMTSNYDVKGRVLVLDMNSQGLFKGEFKNVLFKFKAKLKEIESDDGENYFIVANFSNKISVDDGEIEMKSSDPDNQRGAELIETFYNNNFQDIMDVANPLIVETSNVIYSKFLNNTLARVPADQLLPE